MTPEQDRINKGLSIRAYAKRFNVKPTKMFRLCHNTDARVKMVDGVRSIVVNKVVAQEAKKGK